MVRLTGHNYSFTRLTVPLWLPASHNRKYSLQRKGGKQLLDCEHRAEMPCSRDPEDYRCRAPCAELMVCCSKNYDDYQSLNDTLAVGGTIKRIRHAAHPCQKRLYCEHACQEPCSEGRGSWTLEGDYSKNNEHRSYSVPSFLSRPRLYSEPLLLVSISAIEVACRFQVDVETARP